MFGNVDWGAELDVLDEIGDYYQVKTFIRKEDT